MAKKIIHLCFAFFLLAACVEGQSVQSTKADLCTIEDQLNGTCPGSTLPTCASLGCPYAPSGTGDITKPWEPCFSDVCYCRSADGTKLLACTPETT